MEKTHNNSDGKSLILVANSDDETQKSETVLTVETIKTTSASIKPSIDEIERFISYMNKRFNIKPSNELIVLIQKTNPQIKGYYSPNSWKAHAETKTEGVFKHTNAEQQNNINEITLSSLNLLFEPYETIAHEYAHFLNTYLDNYKGNSRNYHTVDFKKRAEQLLLRCEKGDYGYNETYETDTFKEMIKDFKPSANAFKIFQPSDSRIVGVDGAGHPVDVDGNRVYPKPKGTSRLILLECECGYKIRASKNGHNKTQPLKAICGYCNKEFKEKIREEVTP